MSIAYRYLPSLAKQPCRPGQLPRLSAPLRTGSRRQQRRRALARQAAEAQGILGTSGRVRLSYASDNTAEALLPRRRDG